MAGPAQFQNTLFIDETAAREALEQVRWPSGAVCRALGVNDGERAVLAMKGIEGRRLTYRPTNKAIG